MTSEVTHILQQAWDLVKSAQDGIASSEQRAVSLLQDLTHLSERVHIMASIHDQIAAIFDDIEPKVVSIIGAKTDSDSANADLLTRAQALQGKIDTAAAALSSASGTTVPGAALTVS